MFNYLKRKIHRAALVFEPTPTVEEIHEAFDNASQKAVDAAKEIISTEGTDEIRRIVMDLKASGFVNVPVVTQWEESLSRRMQAENNLMIVEKYSTKYPQYKFIFTDQMVSICNKYGLLCVPVHKYKGNVPQKNLKEIREFRVSDEDTYMFKGNLNSYLFHNTESKAKLQEEEKKYFQMGREFRYHHSNPMLPYREVPLFICAPKGDVIIGPNEEVDGVSVVREVKDPIVLHYVKEGFLIVSKWGPEASDPSLVNEKMN